MSDWTDNDYAEVEGDQIDAELRQIAGKLFASPNSVPIEDGDELKILDDQPFIITSVVLVAHAQDSDGDNHMSLFYSGNKWELLGSLDSVKQALK